ncbi:MAG: hypothetical protein VX899_08615 [Myxococcota bacterium]|nr:hypothetical protein [Myxococcota bacterium]
MHDELPEGIDIIGVNEEGEELGNALVDSDLPWLQDSLEVDAWGAWGVEWRDVILVDVDGAFAGRTNLVIHDLGDPETYAALKAEIEALAPE